MSFYYIPLDQLRKIKGGKQIVTSASIANTLYLWNAIERKKLLLFSLHGEYYVKKKLKSKGVDILLVGGGPT
jgi:hypothetical protein